MEAIEPMSLDMGSLTDEDVSLSESLTEQVATVDDAPPKISMSGISDRLAKVNSSFNYE